MVDVTKKIRLHSVDQPDLGDTFATVTEVLNSGDAGATGNKVYSNAIVAALGNSQGTGAALTADRNVVTGADGTKGVVLPTAADGFSIMVVNTSTTAVLKVYPATGGAINSLGANAAYSVGADKTVVFDATSTTQWYAAGFGAATLTTAEANLLAGVTAGTVAASKAVTADANLDVSGIRNLGMTGTVSSSSGVGAKNGASVVAAEYGDGVIHKTVLTCTATPLTFGDEAGQGQYGGVKVYDFPVGMLCTLGAVIDGAVTLSAPAIDTWDGDIGLGLEAPTDHQDVANKTGQIMPKVSTTQAVAKVATTDAVSVATALTESGARWLDGTGTAKDLFLNVLIDDNGAHDNTITGTFTGTITVVWLNLGTTA